MNNRTPAEVFPPGEFIREELEERGWTQADLAKIMERPLNAINTIIAGKKSVTPETAIGLASAFGTSPEFWLNLETAYQLANASVSNTGAIRERARLFERAPVKDMEKRGWIKPSSTIIELKNHLDSFFSIAEYQTFRAAARASNQQNSELTPEQAAWCIRALQLAKSIPAKSFTKKSFEDGLPKLLKLADFPENVSQVPKVLSEMGIRFVVIEHLPKSKIDGAALWLGEGWDKPVIALSLRYDRIDSFWHTLLHEVMHIKHKDSYVVDVDMVAADRCLSDNKLSEIENRANTEAAEALISKEKMLSFVRRTRPFYSTEKIIQFAHVIKIHPGIIAGQLQYKREIEWGAHRSMLVKIRDFLTASALTDGWGVTITGAK
jgi:HTH-type transcriptional regulator/antitoxin HigA